MLRSSCTDVNFETCLPYVSFLKTQCVAHIRGTQNCVTGNSSGGNRDPVDPQ